MKRIIFVVVIFFQITVNVVFAQRFKPFMSVGIESNLCYKTDNPIVLENIPYEIRNVPKHHDDYVPNSNMGPIDIDVMKQSRLWLTPITLLMSVGLAKDACELESGGFVSVNITAQKNTERNYTSAPGTNTRGYGAALTYIKLNDVSYTYGYFATFRAKVGHVKKDSKMFRDKNVYLFAGYNKSWETLSIKTGWDRYDKLERYKKFNVGYFTNNQIEIGNELRDYNNYFKISFGYGWGEISSLTNWGNAMDITTPSHLFVKMVIGLKSDSRDQKKKK